MNPHSKRNIFVAIGMVVVLGVIAVTFALRPSPPGPVAQIPEAPAAVAQAPDAATPPAPAPDAPAAVAQVPEAPAPAAKSPEPPPVVARIDRATATVGNNAKTRVVEPKPAHERQMAKAEASTADTRTADTRRVEPSKLDTSTADTSVATVAPTAPAVDPDVKLAGDAPANGVERAKSGDEPAMPSSGNRLAADAPGVATSTDSAAADTRISSDVKSTIAADSVAKDVDVGVTTTHGVVVLTGTLATQDAIEHVKNVAEKVKDVKRVDASAMKITSI